ncbi:MAG: hypothetical protein AAGJ82_08805, partial [Bacteroidota bacterium]
MQTIRGGSQTLTSSLDLQFLTYKETRMKKQTLILIAAISILIISCIQGENKQLTDEEIWKLGWRLIASSINENYLVANLQFDTLRRRTETIGRKYLITGLKVKNELGKSDEIMEIINSQDSEMLQEICQKEFLSKYETCKEYSMEEVENQDLQIELIRMYVDDQAARGNLMREIVLKYDIDSTEITQNGGVVVDDKNRNRLKEIFKEHGFPTRKLVGKDAM